MRHAGRWVRYPTNRTDITYQFESEPIANARSGVSPTAGVGRLRLVGIAPDLDSRIVYRLPAPAINTGRVRNAPRQLSRLLHWRERVCIPNVSPEHQVDAMTRLSVDLPSTDVCFRCAGDHRRKQSTDSHCALANARSVVYFGRIVH